MIHFKICYKSYKFSFADAGMIFKTPKKSSPMKRLKTPSKIVITPSKINRKSNMAPAKVVSAFTSPFKPPVPPSPMKNVLKTSLLTLSQTFDFFEQEPWAQSELEPESGT